MAGTPWMGRWGQRHGKQGVVVTETGVGPPTHRQNLLASALRVCKVTQRREQITEKSRRSLCGRGRVLLPDQLGALGAGGAAESVSEAPLPPLPAACRA